MDVGGLRKAIIRAKNIVKVKTSVEKRLDKIEKNHDSEVANLKTEIINLEDVVSGLKMENINLKDVVSGLKEVVSNLKEAFRKESSDRDDYQFRIFRGNLLMDLMRKLFPDEAKKAAHQNTNPKWSSFAENLKEADFKKATKDFNVSEDSAQVMKVLQKFTVVSSLEIPELSATKSDVYSYLASLSETATNLPTIPNTTWLVY